MFHAPTSETQQNDALRNQLTDRGAQELSSPVIGHSLSRTGGGAAFSPSPATSAQRQFARLHRMYGNQAVLRMLSRPTPAIQTKLTVNQPGDIFEQEADRVADQVMRLPAPALQRACACGGSGGECPACKQKEEASLQRVSRTSSAPSHAPDIVNPVLQRTCSSCPDEDKLQRKCAACEEEEKETGLQRKESNAGPQFAPPSVHDVLNSPGQPLDPVTRAFVEPRFGRDFGHVRVHADDRAAESAVAVNAKAYTAGSHVVFGKGEYAPETDSGRFLLAHELAHVLQQGREPSIRRTVATQSSCPPGTNGVPDDPATLENIDNFAAVFADQVANALSDEADAALNGLPDNPSTTFQAYEDRFGLPPASGQGFLNRLTGSVRPTQAEAASGELRILSRRFQLVADMFSQSVAYFCLGVGQHRPFANCDLTCGANDFSGSCRGRHAMSLCPGFWGHNDAQRAGGFIHEAMHIIFGRQAGTVIGGAIRDDDTVPQVPGRNFDVAGCYQSLVADILGFDPDVVCADPL